jgi:hypothetical protein
MQKWYIAAGVIAALMAGPALAQTSAHSSTPVTTGQNFGAPVKPKTPGERSAAQPATESANQPGVPSSGMSQPRKPGRHATVASDAAPVKSGG